MLPPGLLRAAPDGAQSDAQTQAEQLVELVRALEDEIASVRARAAAAAEAVAVADVATARAELEAERRYSQRLEAQLARPWWRKLIGG